MVDSKIRYDPQQLTEYCKKNNISWMAVFGSAVRGDLRDESDLDILVEFRSYEGLGLFRFMKIQREIGEMFQRQVDLGVRDALSIYIRDEVLKECEVIYEER